MQIDIAHLLTTAAAPLLVFVSVTAVAGFFTLASPLERMKMALMGVIVLPITIITLAHATGWLEVVR